MTITHPKTAPNAEKKKPRRAARKRARNDRLTIPHRNLTTITVAPLSCTFVTESSG
ncbi:hypothetical protein Porky_50 [Mycobacterium phage Porky]|uniref:Uncharacterized protein n=2 Tax=Kostyavirus TaxID=1623284 RepID=B5A612_9CAUD|nr:hypothetical protein Porky_50 [Mycobacterium phage Porky]ACF33867.1 hypothetical protein Porky_50 [Mycobacterium phage Porky]AQP30772.1 hypothetical protein SEA_MAXXINISTA_54 [Mycobacterium phage Maxxinista]